MSFLLTLVLVVQVLCALGVIVLVLLQHGKGADMGAAFGSGASGSLFGATGSANFLSRTTAVLAAGFFVCTLALAFLSNGQRAAPGGSLIEQAGKAAPAAAPGAAQDTPAPATGSAAPPAAGASGDTSKGGASDIPK